MMKTMHTRILSHGHATALSLAVIALLSFVLAGCGDDKKSKPGDTDIETLDGDVEETVEALEEHADETVVEEAEETPDGEVEGEADGLTEEQQQVLDLIAEGKRWLELGQANESRPFFARAAELDPDNLEAHFGVAFSESQTSLEYLSSLVSLVRQLMSGKDPGWSDTTRRKGDHTSQADWVAEEWAYLFGKINEYLEISHEHYAVMLAHPDIDSFKWTIDTQIPIYMSLKKTAWLKGELTVNEVRLFDAMVNLMWSFATIFGNLDLHGDLSPVINYAQGHFSEKLTVGTVLPLVVNILNSDQRFLGSAVPTTLVGQAVAQQWIIALDAALMTWDNVQAEGCPMDEAKRPANRMFSCFNDIDKGKQLLMHIYAPDPEGVEDEVEIWLNVLPANYADIIADFKTNLESGQAGPMDLLSEIGPALGCAFSVANAFGLLSLLSINLADLGLGDSFTPDVVANALKIVFPKGMGMDFGAFWKDPLPLRDLLPRWTTDRPEDENILLTSWECPDELADDGFPDGSGTLLCEATDEATGLVDADHFVGTEYEQSKDGVLLGSPYFVWQNPDMGGLLYTDAKLLGVGSETGFAPGTQTTVNVAVGTIIKKILNFVGK